MSSSDQLEEEVQQLRRELDQARRENTLLRQKLDAMARRLFGKKSEQLNAAQMELLLSGMQGEAVDAEQEVREQPVPALRPKKRARRRRLIVPEDLEVVREVIEPEFVLASPQDYKQIGEEVSRRLDYQPGKFFWRETARPKYARIERRDLPPVIAPAPPQVIEKGTPAPGLLAHILVSRFCDHLPYYRQQGIFRQRHGVHIARQQMVQWTEGSVKLLQAITDSILQGLRAQRYLQVDETMIKYQDPDLKGRCPQGYLWTALAPRKAVYFHWETGRSAQCLPRLLGKDFLGLIQCDGYVAYETYRKQRQCEELDLAGCWAHTRRYFFEAQAEAPRLVGWILKHIAALYEWEAELRAARAGPKLREVKRQSASRMVVERLHRALLQIRGRYLPKSLMGKAVNYALGQWPALQLILERGQAELDTNLVENAIRPTAVGKKNWLFMGSPESGTRNAVIYTLVANCRMHGIDPYAYLKDVLEKLPRTTNQQVADLTPLNWLKSRSNGTPDSKSPSALAA